ncbi:helix-turn-helix domain-containing protein [Embleya sp. NPDC059267]|uniref:helix-turn-helix domain-containing protein n=1 Tax=Embleya sp. NPDC059267 TaxID=3346798 RepID=UPI0036772139
MDARVELSEFLKSRRARLSPEDVGLRAYGGRRRVAGLRREELAGLAGISVAHYTRLEQGRSDSVSAEALAAIGRALRLDEDERTYLNQLTRPDARTCPETAAPPRAGLRHLVASFDATPAILVGRHTEIVAWNPVATALFGDFAAMPEGERSISDLIFRRSDVRDLHGAGWEPTAVEHVAHLRVLSACYRGDRRLMAHIERLRAASPEFDRMWSSHPVARAGGRFYRLHHPVVGDLDLYGELVTLPVDLEYSGLDLFAAEPGSPSERALRRLADLSRERDSPSPPPSPAQARADAAFLEGRTRAGAVTCGSMKPACP